MPVQVETVKRYRPYCECGWSSMVTYTDRTVANSALAEHKVISDGHANYKRMTRGR